MNGKYKHFKGNEYQVVGECFRDNERFILYKPLYNDSGYWIRPYEMFFETIEREGKTFRRFELIEESFDSFEENEIVVTDSENLEKFRVIKNDNIFIIKEKIMSKVKVAFVCVHNSCRSQMAEALGKMFASEVFESYSAGTAIKDQINQDAVRIIKDLYNVDMNESHRSKLLSDIPEVDVVITMGCNVDCPNLPCKHREDWGLDDPSGKADEEFVKTAKTIEEKVMNLKARIEKGELF